MGRKKPSARDEESGPAAGGAGGKSKKKAFVIDDDEYSIGTELSEEASVSEEKVAAVGNKKKGKKGVTKKMELKDDDEEVGGSVVGLEEEEDAQVVKFAVQKKGKGKKGSSSVPSGSNFGLLGEDDDEDGNDIDEEDVGPSEPVIAFTGKKKPSKDKKSGAKFSSAFDLLDEEEESEDNDESSKEEDEVAFSGKKKSSKNKKSGGKFSSFDLLDEEENEEEKSEREDEVAFSGKKKSSKNKKSSVKFSSPFDILDGEEESKDVGSKEDDEVVFSGRKKPSKNKKSGGNFSSAYDVLDGEEDNEDKNESSKEEDKFAFSGKKKPSKVKKGGAKLSSAFDLLDGEEENKDEDAEDEDDIGISFTGKKKKKSSKGMKKASSGNSVHDEDNEVDVSVSKFGNDLTVQDGGELEEDVLAIKFSGKKKSSKKKNVSDDTAMEEVLNNVTSSDVSKPEQHDADSTTNKQTSEVVAGNSKNKKNKKKGARTGQEEEDIDQILAELGGASSSKQDPAHVSTSIMPPQDKPQNQSELEDAAGDKEAEGPAETGASKKKKKKKDKEKEKKAAVTEEKQEGAKDEMNAKMPPGKKVPKHVREMQERLAKVREAEEKKKREEEERLRKEEEERLRQEELERLAEEKKRLKKEREKEKLLKKKQEGKLLTGKQKEEARRLEQMRKQILANAALQLPTREAAQAPAKRPIYQKKKVNPQTQSNGAATLDSAESTVSNESRPDTPSELDAVKAESVDDVESLSAKDKSEVTEENVVDDEDDEDWDAKSWDDDLKLPGKSDFADEEADSGSETIHSKEIKNTQTSSKNVDAPSVVNKPSGFVEKVDSGMLPRFENAKKKASEVEVVEKRNKKPIQTKEETGQLSNSSHRNEQNLRSPICCIMGHVDAGKTKLLDCIRRTNVQEGEAGGITQQIGATYFPAENIRERTKELKADATLNVPGLLVIDTPGHESFTNLRSRGSGLCDIAILVVDIMHGLEPQTIESLNLLKMRNTEFIVALNKVDRLYGWKTCRNSPIVKAMKQQSKDVQLEFNMRLTQVVTQFKEQGLNTELYYKNKEMGETFSIVPTSAISGEGIPDLLLLLVQWAQKTMVQRLTYSEEVQCTVLEVKVVEGHGTTIDVVLVNGVLHEGDQIVVCGLQGPIVTSIRALLTPHPMKELRVKGAYMHHKEIKAAQGIKITAQGLEHAIAGTSLYVVKPNDDLEAITDAAMEDMQSVMSRIDKSGEGVYVQASTLGSLEALLEFLKTPEVNIPVSGISIGPVHKKDVMKASVMLEKKKEYATILAFDVKVTQESRELADELGVKIFIADIIYHLFDQFKAYINNLKEEKKKEAADEAVFPCVLKIMPNCVFNKKDPIVLGVDVLEGILKIGTPICVPQREFIEIGRIASIENNHKPVDYAKKGQKVAIKIIGSNPDEQQKMFGRHFEIEDELVSKISRNSLDALKEHYADDLTTEDKRLLFKLKRLFKIP